MSSKSKEEKSENDEMDELKVQDNEDVKNDSTSFTTTENIDKTQGLRSSFRQMKKKHSKRKTSLHEPISHSLEVKNQPKSPPPSPANPSQNEESTVEDLEKVKEILINELPDSKSSPEINNSKNGIDGQIEDLRKLVDEVELEKFENNEDSKNGVENGVELKKCVNNEDSKNGAENDGQIEDLRKLVDEVELEKCVDSINDHQILNSQGAEEDLSIEELEKLEEESKSNKEEIPKINDDTENESNTEGERPVDVNIPTAMKSSNRPHPKNSVGAKVAFIEPVRSLKRDRNKTQKISFENLKEVELKKSNFFEDDEEHIGKIFGNVEELDKDKPQEFEKSKTEKFLNLILCRKDLAEKKLNEKPVPIRQLFKYGTRLDNFLVIIGIIMACFCGFCQPLFAIVSGQLANTLLLLEADDPQFYRDGFQAVITFVGVGIFLCIVAFLQFCCFNIACLRIIRQIRVNYLRSILRQNCAWFELNHSGALNTKLNDNIERIHEGIGDKLGLLIRNGVQFLTGLVVAFIWSWQMALPLCILSPIIASAMSMSARWISNASRKEMGIYSQAGEIAEEAIAGVRTVVAFNGQKIEVERYRSALEKGMKSGLRKGFHSGLLSGFLLFTVMIFMGSSIVYGTWLYKVGIIKTPGDIFVVLLAIMSGAYHLGMASPHLMVILTSRVAASTVYKTIDRTPSIDPYSQEGRKVYAMKGKITFKNVTFRYPSRQDCKVLKGFSFTVQPGQTIALVGHSGSGKSTVVGILNRLYEYESGSVTLDGHDLRELNVKWLRSVIGTVQQEPAVFNATVEENLRMGCSTLTEKQMVTACQVRILWQNLLLI